jgi:hypothetical protein
MRAFGKKVSARLLLPGTLAILAGAYVTLRYLAPSLVGASPIAAGDAALWSAVIALVTAVVLLRYAGSTAGRKLPAPTVAANSGARPSITLTHHGDPATYRVHAKIAEIVDGSANPWPAPFQCELRTGGSANSLEARLRHGERVTVLIGGVEAASVSGAFGPMPLGDTLVICRGRQGVNVPVPDTGVILELRVTSSPLSENENQPRRFRVIREDKSDRVLVTEV